MCHTISHGSKNKSWRGHRVEHGKRDWRQSFLSSVIFWPRRKRMLSNTILCQYIKWKVRPMANGQQWIAQNNKQISPVMSPPLSSPFLFPHPNPSHTISRISTQRSALSTQDQKPPDFSTAPTSRAMTRSAKSYNSSTPKEPKETRVSISEKHYSRCSWHTIPKRPILTPSNVLSKNQIERQKRLANYKVAKDQAKKVKRMDNQHQDIRTFLNPLATFWIASRLRIGWIAPAPHHYHHRCRLVPMVWLWSNNMVVSGVH